jgi:hypothetical protein
VLPKGEPIFCEAATHVAIDDNAAGEFLLVTQQSGHVEAESQTIQLDAHEWPVIREAVDRMFDEIAKHDRKEGAK